MKRLIIFLTILIVACSKDETGVDIERKHGQLDYFYTLESCEDSMWTQIYVKPYDTQTEVGPNHYNIEKDNWVAIIGLRRVDRDKDIFISYNNSTVISMYNEWVEALDMKEQPPHKGHGGGNLCAAKIISEITITADCQLFGRPPGENLSDKFIIPYIPTKRQWHYVYLISYDERKILANYHFDECPVALSTYISPGVMAPNGFQIQLSEPFVETPGTINFHLEFDAWTEIFEPYADRVDPGYVPKGHDRHLYADFSVDVSGNTKTNSWIPYRDDEYHYPY